MSDDIKKRVIHAFKAFYENDLDEALFHISPAIDATASKRYPSLGVGERIRSFLKDEQDLIYGFSTAYKCDISGSNVTILFGSEGELQSIVYKFIRCKQAHGKSIDKSKITLGGDFGIGGFVIQGASIKPRPGTILISRATVLSMIFAVVSAIENLDIDFSGTTISLFSEPKMDLAPFVGNKPKFTQICRDHFA